MMHKIMVSIDVKNYGNEALNKLGALRCERISNDIREAQNHGVY